MVPVSIIVAHQGNSISLPHIKMVNICNVDNTYIHICVYMYVCVYNAPGEHSYVKHDMLSPGAITLWDTSTNARILQ